MGDFVTTCNKKKPQRARDSSSPEEISFYSFIFDFEEG